MKFSTEYKAQLDKFCESINMPDPDEMLKLAKARANADKTGSTLERTEITMTKNNKKRLNRFTVIAAVAAASLAASAASVYAYSNGGFSALFGNIFHDEVASSLVEEGYIQEHDIKDTDGIFDATLTAVAGDIYNPTLVFDIVINDKELAALSDTIEIDAVILDEEFYDSDSEHYGTFTGIGYRDEEVNNLFHVSIGGGWTLVNSRSGAANIRTIRIGKDEKMQEFEVNMEYRFDIPEESLKKAQNICIDNLAFDYNGLTIQIGTTMLTNYETEFNFYTMIPETYFEGVEFFSDEYYDRLNEEFEKFVSKLTLVADGVEYKAKEGKEYRNAGYDFDFMTNLFNHIAYVDFPAIDYENVKNICLVADGNIIDLRIDGHNCDLPPLDSLWYDCTVETTYEDIDFKGSLVMYSTERTGMYFTFKVPENICSDDMTDFEKEDALNDIWFSLLGTMSFNVDGVEYGPLDNPFVGAGGACESDGSGYWSCYANAYFHGFDMKSADKITFTVNGDTFTLVDSEKSMDYGEDEELMTENDDYEENDSEENMTE